MRAVVITSAGSADVLALRNVQRPTPTAGDLLIRVMASGVNRADILQRQGVYPAPPDVPADIPGLEYAGVVEEVGSDVTAFSPGDRVMGIVGGGACAEYVLTHETLALTIPPALDFHEAAALPEAFLTAYDAMVLQGGLTNHGSVAITAASSGVGTAASQIARAHHATVFGSTRSDEKVASLVEHGVTHPVCGGAAELIEAIRNSDVNGVDVIVDLVGGSGVDLLLRGLRTQGTMVVVGLLGGAKTNLNLGRLLGKRATLKGTVLRSRPQEQKRALVECARAELLPLFASGQLQPVIHRSYPLNEARTAHIDLESNAHVGKIVLIHT